MNFSLMTGSALFFDIVKRGDAVPTPARRAGRVLVLQVGQVLLPDLPDLPDLRGVRARRPSRRLLRGAA
jgi:hypothetical protein